MNYDQCINSLSMPLPEVILKLKWAGDLEGAIRAIDLRLEKDVPEMLRQRLVCEREIIRLRYGLGGNRPLTQRETAARLAISRS